MGRESAARPSVNLPAQARYSPSHGFEAFQGTPDYPWPETALESRLTPGGIGAKFCAGRGAARFLSVGEGGSEFQAFGLEFRPIDLSAQNGLRISGRKDFNL